MRIYVDVCDVCQDPTKAIKVYTVSVEGRSGKTVRCEEHAVELEDIVAELSENVVSQTSKPPAKRSTTTRRTSRSRPLKVASMKDVERAKQR